MAIRAINTLAISAATLAFAPQLLAQEDGIDQLEEVVVTGIRASLANALDQKRDANNLVEVIQAEDIGKLPDQNLAEVLENVPGIQITRTAGVGTGVQIRGTNDNRTE
ncbi:TonB-dependent receptor plug domain-containing protein, partial [Halorubrum tibetense]